MSNAVTNWGNSDAFQKILRVIRAKKDGADQVAAGQSHILDLDLSPRPFSSKRREIWVVQGV